MPSIIPAAPIEAFPVVIAGPTGQQGPVGATGAPGPDVTAAIAALEVAIADLTLRVTVLEEAV